MTMARCGYKAQIPDYGEWECPLDALHGEEYCYWHKEEDGKEPTEEQLEELKRETIFCVYLKEANLKEANSQEMFLGRAQLQKANLKEANLQEAFLFRANLQETDLCEADLHGANLAFANLWKANLFYADMHGSRLYQSYLKEADLNGVNLDESTLHGAQLQKTCLYNAKLNEADISNANLQEARLHYAELKNANLSGSKPQGTNLREVRLDGANLSGTMFDSKTVLDGSVLIGANLPHSYFDEVKSFRNATVFQEGSGKEINEIWGDAIDDWFFKILEMERTKKYSVKIILKLILLHVIKILTKNPCIPIPLKPSALDMGVIEEKSPLVAVKLRGKRLIRYFEKDKKIIFFDWLSGCIIENIENRWRRGNLTRIKELNELILKDGKIQSEFLYKGSRASLYEASYEVYNNLYNFYIANGRLDRAAHVHYRRGEAHRKLRWAGGGLKNRARSIFDLLILRTLTGYGDKISRPIGLSGVIIGFFALLFYLVDGIVKNVNGESVAPNWIDYLYHSITTFTSLGYSNIQPNLAAGHLPQVLVAAESGLGVLMMALIIFVVTYQVSR